MRFESGELQSSHVLTEFDCTQRSLNDWLTTSAHRANTSGTAKVYVWTAPPSATVHAYFAICPTEVVREQDGISRSMSGGHSRIPGFLLARLALDRSIHGAGYGGQLLLDAIERIVAASAISGGRLIVVDAIDDEAARFYERFGFIRVTHRPRRLVMKVATAAAALHT
ncbi:GNAT family N-acetyltransferase [Gordonia phthalatica]|uniref:Acetyltransferase n=1 Tax=Gordonia phthalatica TaxID=1136941 RepID=A0A0N9MN77_9ACTN|nr:GNAT family N-acetyltransferase [Gordonia phthalatica]ALG84186.1 acetyltransferase [Gordonia phthalatica]